MNEDLLLIACVRANALTEAARALVLRQYSLSLDSQKEADVCEATAKYLDSIADKMLKKVKK